MPDHALIVFVKAPRPGFVKTRLAGALGPEAAARLYRRLAEATLRQPRPQAGEYQRVVAFTPSDARHEIERWLPGESLVAQRGDTLGERMTRAIDGAFRRGARRVALIGSDVVGLDRRLVGTVFARCGRGTADPPEGIGEVRRAFSKRGMQAPARDGVRRI